MPKPVLEIDGNNFSTLEGFFQEISDSLIPGVDWGHNLDAFDDILRRGFGTPGEGFVLCWKNHELSRTRLGYGETVRQLQKRLARCHTQNIPVVEAQLLEAQQRVGPTAFDWLIEIIREHGPGGPQAEDSVELLLQ
jgi:RNAse (barnase) inhibitor barstar